MTLGRVLHGKACCGYFLKLVGSIRYSMRDDVSGFLEGFFATRRADALLIDMTETTQIDSTGLGLIAKGARLARAAGAPRPSIISSHPDVTLLLTSMGLEQVFDLLRELPCAPEKLEELPVAAPGELEMARGVIAAHRSLMDLNERNRETFDKLVAMLEAEVNRAGSAQGR